MRFYIFAAAALAGIFAASSLAGFSIDIFFFFALVFVIAAVIYSDRKNIKFTAGILLMRRTKRFRDKIDDIANGHRRFWGAFGSIGVAAAIIIMAAGSVMLADQSVKIATGATKDGAKLILPGPEASLAIPGVLLVPWWIWIISVAFVIIPHETMHGIMCRIDNIRIKSVGWVLLLVLPGAFVEPDEKQLNKASRKTKMRVYAAGAFTNIVIAGVMLIILVLSFSFAFHRNGLVFDANDNSSFGRNMTAALLEVNGVKTTNVNVLLSELAKHKKGDVIELKTAQLNSVVPDVSLKESMFSAGFITKNISSQNITLKGGEKAALGIYVKREFSYANPGPFSIELHNLLFWLFAFSLFVGIVNILPLKPLDGGLLFEEIVKKFTPRHKTIVAVVSGLMLFLILFNIAGPYLMG